MAEAARGDKPKIDVSLPVISPEKIASEGSIGEHAVQKIPVRAPVTPVACEAARVFSVSEERALERVASVRSGEKVEERHIEQAAVKTPLEERVEEVQLLVVPQTSLQAAALRLKEVWPLSGHPPAAHKERTLDEHIEEVEIGLIPTFPIPGRGLGPFRMEQRMRDLGVSDVRVAVINGGRIEWSREWSRECVGKMDERPGTLLQAASITKTVTALTILSLMGDEKYKEKFDRGLDTDIRTILVDPLLWAQIDPKGVSLQAGHEITLRKLLSHTAGISELTGDGLFYSVEAIDREDREVQHRIAALTQTLSSPSFQGDRRPLETEVLLLQKRHQELEEMRSDVRKALHKPVSSDDILMGRLGQLSEELGKVYVESVPRDSFKYSNLGFTLLQKVIETVTTPMPFEEVVHHRVLSPLGMEETTFSPPVESVIGGNDNNGEPLRGIWRAIPYAAAGGLWTNAKDFAKVVLGIQGALAGRPMSDGGPPLIGKELAGQMMSRPPAEDRHHYALGVMVEQTEEGHLYFCHKGGNGGCSNLMLGDTEGRGVIILTNSEIGGHILVPEILRSVAQSYEWPGVETLPVAEVLVKPEEVCPVNLETWVHGDGGIGGTYVVKIEHSGEEPEMHTVEVVYEGGQALAKIDGGEPEKEESPVKTGGEKPKRGQTISLIPLNQEVACLPGGSLGEYNLCRFTQEDDGTMVLLLFGQRHIGPKKAK